MYFVFANTILFYLIVVHLSGTEQNIRTAEMNDENCIRALTNIIRTTGFSMGKPWSFDH